MDHNCKDCEDCYKKDTDDCEPNKWRVGSYIGCHNSAIALKSKPKHDTRTKEQAEQDKKTQEFYDQPGYKGD